MLPETSTRPLPDITLARGTIHNPDEPRHFMKLKPLPKRVRIWFGNQLLAESTEALRLIEVGGDLYDPPVYLPLEDVQARLSKSDRHSICPLKGEASYFDLRDDADVITVADIAWHYPQPYSFAAKLADYVAFYADKVTVEEIPL